MYSHLRMKNMYRYMILIIVLWKKGFEYETLSFL